MPQLSFPQWTGIFLIIWCLFVCLFVVVVLLFVACCLQFAICCFVVLLLGGGWGGTPPIWKTDIVVWSPQNWVGSSWQSELHPVVGLSPFGMELPQTQVLPFLLLVWVRVCGCVVMVCVSKSLTARLRSPHGLICPPPQRRQTVITCWSLRGMCTHTRLQQSKIFKSPNCVCRRGGMIRLRLKEKIYVRVCVHKLWSAPCLTPLYGCCRCQDSFVQLGRILITSSVGVTLLVMFCLFGVGSAGITEE